MKSSSLVPALALVAALPTALSTGCSRGTAPAAEPPEFAAAWSALTAKGVEAVYVGQEHGGGPPGGPPPPPAPPPATTPPPPAATAPEALPDQEVMRVIRGGLGGVKRCYAMEEQSGNVGSGKAIV